jgi:hypothetical protein
VGALATTSVLVLSGASDVPWYTKHVAQFLRDHPEPRWHVEPTQVFEKRNFPVQPSLRSPGPGLLAVKATGKSMLPFHDAPVFWYVQIREHNSPLRWEMAFDQPEQMFASKKGVEFTVQLPEFVVPVHFPPGEYTAYAELRMMVDHQLESGEVRPWGSMCGMATDIVTLEPPVAQQPVELAPIQYPA